MKVDARWVTILLVGGAMTLPGCQMGGEEISENEASSAISAQPLALEGSSLGMVVDDSTDSAIVFNADTNTILGTVQALGEPVFGFPPGGCSITADGTKGFFARFASITVVDLTPAVPTVTGAPNPIASPGFDTALSPDGKLLVVGDGAFFAPISVIDVATQTQVSTFDLGEDSASIDVCSDGSVLVASLLSSRVRRLTLSGAGILTDTGESLFAREPRNVYCSPSATSGIVVGLVDNTVTSFKIPGLTQVSIPNVRLRALSGAINHAGDRAYFHDFDGSVSGFSFDQTTGILGSAPLFQVFVGFGRAFFGADGLAVHPSDKSLYVPRRSGISILDAQTGATTGSITVEGFHELSGICFGPVEANKPPVARCADRRVPADAACHANASIDDGSFDPDEGEAFQCTQVPSGPFDEGTTHVTLTCTDSHGASSSCSADVTVADATPPTVVTTTPTPLWPPNHQYHRIGLDVCIASIQDACDSSLDIASHAKVTACTSDEPHDGLGDGDSPDDCVIVDDHSVDARAERAGGGNGRVYTIHFTVTDDAGNAADHTCMVGVPHSQNGAPAVDDAAQPSRP
jgi:hypothetical protein